jgi:FdhD protein
MVQKAAEAGIAVLVAVSAPTGLTIAQAEAAGLTLVASARPGRVRVFAHPERLA